MIKKSTTVFHSVSKQEIVEQAVANGTTSG